MDILEWLSIVPATTLGTLVGHYLRSYVGKKGENLATKEDIAEITNRQEEIKHRFNELIETSKQRHALRTLVADKRMDAHQQAFKRVKQLLAAREDLQVIARCKDWMDEHCLYLSTEARKGMLEAIGHAESRAHFLAEARSEVIDPQYLPQYHERAVQAWTGIMSALPHIVSGVELPPLGAEELKKISDSVAEA